MIDEADEAMPGQVSGRKRSMSLSSLDSGASSPGPRKRKPGPIPKDLPYRRPTTPPPLSPIVNGNINNNKSVEKPELVVTPPLPLGKSNGFIRSPHKHDNNYTKGKLYNHNYLHYYMQSEIHIWFSLYFIFVYFQFCNGIWVIIRAFWHENNT